jgi:hypothetical protein
MTVDDIKGTRRDSEMVCSSSGIKIDRFSFGKVDHKRRDDEQNTY